MNKNVIKSIKIIALISLAVFSLVLIYLELTVSQAYVRPVLDDVKGPHRLFAANTSLCVFLEGGSALLFMVCAALARQWKQGEKDIPFYCSQVAFFTYLALDDRFMIHEWIGGRFGFNDAYYILALGLVEAALLLFRARLWQRGSRFMKLFLAIGFCFGVMFVIDGFVPREITPPADSGKTKQDLGLRFYLHAGLGVFQGKSLSLGTGKGAVMSAMIK